MNNDAKAVLMAKELKTKEGEILAHLILMWEADEFTLLGFSSMWEYCVERLKFSEGQSQHFQRVAKTSRVVPELTNAVINGELSLSKARYIASIITPENKSTWIENAKTLTHKELERAVTAVNPRAHIREKIKPIAPTLSELRTTLDMEAEANLRAVTDILAQKLRRAPTLAEVVAFAMKFTREKTDPSLRKKVSAGKRVAKIRDGNQCTYTAADGRRCTAKRHLHVHHLSHREHGGSDSVDNLITLCAAHHRAHHGHTLSESSTTPAYLLTGRILTMDTMKRKPKVNPLSRQPRTQRLVMAVRGGAGVGKSFFARSMSEAGLGRLCIFDMERKTRLLKGVGQTFDGLELERPDELPDFISWALEGEGRDQNYGCFALDSWAAYFGAKHSETIAAVRERTGDPLAQPSAEELAADQMLHQAVLRRLCMESGKSIVIVDQIPAKGKDAKEDNEVGRVLPMTAGGLEYFVDIMVEVSLQERDGEIIRVFQIIKSNSPAFEVGFEMTGNVTFKDFLNHLTKETGTEISVASPMNEAVAEYVDAVADTDEEAYPEEPPMTVQDLIEKALAHGFKQADIVTASRVYHGQPNIYRLNGEQILDLDRRLSARIDKQDQRASA